MRPSCSKLRRDKTAPTFGPLFPILWVIVILGLLAVSCAPQPSLARGQTLKLAAFSENSVAVVVQLGRTASGEVTLSATFTPLEAGFHLYSKDLPRSGVDGLGRPTLLELTPNAKMQACGALAESIASYVAVAGPGGLPTYPAGPVTLSIPVYLPPGHGWIDDEISLTYMACSANGCKAPVQEKIVPIKVPGADALSN